MPDSSFDIPAFQPKPFVWDATAAIIQSLQTIPYRANEAPSKSIAPQEAEALVQWVVAGVADRLKKRFPAIVENWCEHSKGKCAIASAAARDLTQDLPSELRKNFNMNGPAMIPHDAVILHLPVQSGGDDAAEWKHYLIDPTLVQFFYDHRLGDRLTASPEGAEFGKQLITNGYAELTEANAKVYVEAFVPPMLAKPMLKKTEGSYLKLLATSDFGEAEQNNSQDLVRRQIRNRTNLSRP